MIPANLIIAVYAFALGVLVRDVAQDYRDIRAERVNAPAMRSEMGAIRPRCPEPSAGWIAKQPDGGGWSVHCLKGIRA